ncbi:hypothetical protein QLQ15_16440 [Lysobacter sp. LF1]|uniref:Uncharacterized protein n=1 Tax=Lysobacter stagni TaxID=3045172 RepID=A0ABT6XK00_9GAMM|nr:hypothetical protein [Lysobacter sp. LF1]MDI9240494.1 hypothetical protein [Lysobacter sp. LF1]
MAKQDERPTNTKPSGPQENSGGTSTKPTKKAMDATEPLEEEEEEE